jgi:hypothetical protein
MCQGECQEWPGLIKMAESEKNDLDTGNTY